MALVGNTFYQASSADPGTGHAMYYWNQTDTGLVYIRNAGDTAWVQVGDSAQPFLGQLSTQGGNMNGAITGAHGLSSASTNNFSAGLLYTGGDVVSTKVYVDAQVAILNAAIASGIATAIASSPSLNLSTKVAKASGEWSGTGSVAGKVIDRPTYTDSVQADDSECIYGVYFAQQGVAIVNGCNDIKSIIETSTRTFTIDSVRMTGATRSEDLAWAAHWWIMAFRKNS